MAGIMANAAKAGKMGGPWFLFGLIFDQIAEFIPSFEEEMDVVVYGHRGADMKDLLFLAYAIAFGKIERRDFLGDVIFQGFVTPPGMLSVEYNLVEKEVRVKTLIKYSPVGNFAGGFPAGGNEMTLGPTETTVGRKFDWWHWEVDGLVPAPPDIGKFVDKLIFAPVGVGLDDPPPPGDDGLRGTFLKKLIHQALSDPCTPPVPPPGAVKKE